MIPLLHAMPTLIFTFATCGPGLLLYWEESWKYLYWLASWLSDCSSKYRLLQELQVWMVKRERKLTSLGNQWLAAAEEEKKIWADRWDGQLFRRLHLILGWCWAAAQSILFKKSHKYGTQNTNRSGKKNHLTCKPLLRRLANKPPKSGLGLS